MAAVLAEPFDESRVVANIDEAADRRISEEFAAAGIYLGTDVMVT